MQGVFYSNGNTETMNTCMEYCCQQKDCDLAFRIEQGCYTVHCKDKEQCKAREARQTKYRPQIAYKKGATFRHYGKCILVTINDLTMQKVYNHYI